MKFLCSLWLLISSVSFADVYQKIHTIEEEFGGRIGVSAMDTGTRHTIEYRAAERFPFCSTFKVMGVAAILKESLKDPAFLNRRIHYMKKDLLDYSPITEKHVDDGMRIAELCRATITTSDNTAMNLLMRILGGPGVVSAFARSIGDEQFNLTRWEPDLNTAIPGEKRDTTTARAMRMSLQKLLLGSVLHAKQRTLLRDWLIHNETGDHRIRAGVTKQWVVADKTGTGSYGTTNDIGVIYPPHCKPIVLVVFFTQKEKNAAANEAVIAKVTKMVVDEFEKTDRCLRQG